MALGLIDRAVTRAELLYRVLTAEESIPSPPKLLPDGSCGAMAMKVRQKSDCSRPGQTEISLQTEMLTETKMNNDPPIVF